VAIGEAKRHATALGFQVISLDTSWIPIDFFAIRHGCLTLIRVRRIKYGDYNVPDIEVSCDREIAELREFPITGDIVRELWVKGCDKQFHRYKVMPDRVEAIEKGSEKLSFGQQMLVEG
jgi:hypothetical protein